MNTNNFKDYNDFFERCDSIHITGKDEILYQVSVEEMYQFFFDRMVNCDQSPNDGK